MIFLIPVCRVSKEDNVDNRKHTETQKAPPPLFDPLLSSSSAPGCESDNSRSSKMKTGGSGAPKGELLIKT